MPTELLPYPAYRDSGIPWLGQVPAHWDVARIKFLFREKNERSNDGHGVLLSLTRAHGLLPQSEASNRLARAEDLSNYKVCRPGDLVMNRMQAWSGMFAVADIEGLVSPDYSAFSPLRKLKPEYFEQMFKTPLLVEQFAKRSKGIGSGFNRLYTPDFGAVPIAFPGFEEQSAIVRFLNYVDRRVQRHTRAKQSLITLLGEQKQALIHRTVTLGLDPNVRLKSSGVEWLGDVPEHWVIKPLKRWSKINARTLGEKTEPDLQFRYVDIGTVKTGRLVREPERMRFENAPSRARRVLRKGDTIVSTVRTYLREVWLVSEDASDLVASTGFAVLSPSQDVEPEYLAYVIQSDSFVNRVTANSIGVAYPSIAETVLARLQVAAPPTRNEQRELIKWIETKSAPINQAVERWQREVGLMREYRARLIADVVLGKLDVRSIDLPALTEGEPLMDIDAVDDVEAEEMSDFEKVTRGNA